MNLLAVRSKNTPDPGPAWRDLMTERRERGALIQYVFDDGEEVGKFASFLKQAIPCQGILCWFTGPDRRRLTTLLKYSQQNSIPIYYVIAHSAKSLLSELEMIEEYQPSHYFLSLSGPVEINAIVRACRNLQEAGFSGSYLVYSDGSVRLLKNYDPEHPFHLGRR